MMMPLRTTPSLPPIAALAESDFSDSETDSCPSVPPSSPLSSDFMSDFLDGQDRYRDSNQIKHCNNVQEKRNRRYSSHDDGRNFNRDVKFDAREPDRFSGPVPVTPVTCVVRLPELKVDRRDAASPQRDVAHRSTGSPRNSDRSLNSFENSYMCINQGVKTPERGISGNREGMSLKEYRFRHFDVKVAPPDDTAPPYAPGMQTETEPVANVVLNPDTNSVPDQPRRRARARSVTYEPTIFRCVQPDCDEHFETLDEVIAHTPVHRGQFGDKDSVRCAWPDCNWTSNMVGNAKRHFLVIKHKKKGFVCDECSEMYTRKDALKRHQIKRHNHRTDEDAALDEMMRLLRDSEDTD
ncbi:uncharacterized protein BT62DRAFT_924281 [Guyanagaster necrorhizus]|uniref:C2H2-type domain-containing protein n=1 Tax=Guyanagaster necrorhizus TaxID=856835 RepID=A0A9P7VGD4_9AGAR|nr:uncharacterized protein BT62DRAFT_924281 [Guyanagaster necrorhizus MCA 3950]KAG7440072.1 hypothetical protein BT62DRAFT_924281 [Guyanagaster necrorhizus MCA 3950]